MAKSKEIAPVHAKRMYMIYSDYKRNERQFFKSLESAMNASVQSGCTPVYAGILYRQDGNPDIFVAQRAFQQLMIDFPEFHEDFALAVAGNRVINDDEVVEESNN